MFSYCTKADYRELTELPPISMSTPWIIAEKVQGIDLEMCEFVTSGILAVLGSRLSRKNITIHWIHLHVHFVAKLTN